MSFWSSSLVHAPLLVCAFSQHGDLPIPAQPVGLPCDLQLEMGEGRGKGGEREREREIETKKAELERKEWNKGREREGMDGFI